MAVVNPQAYNQLLKKQLTKTKKVGTALKNKKDPLHKRALQLVKRLLKKEMLNSPNYLRNVGNVPQNNPDGEHRFKKGKDQKESVVKTDKLESMIRNLIRTEIEKIRDEASQTAHVPAYQTPHAFKKSTKDALVWDDEDDDDELLGGVKDVRKKRHKKFGEAQIGTQLKYSTPEAKTFVERDVQQMGKFLNKASQQSIKVMLSGVKSGKYDAMDLIRGIKEGPAQDTSVGVRSMLQVLWGKVEKRFRSYLRGKKRR